MTDGTATIRDVARRAAVHPGTASRALNESTRSLVKAETAERVIAAAAALGYQPNYLARSFKTKRTFSVGVVIPDINNPLFPPIVRGIEERLSAAGYVALLANTDNDTERERRVLDGLSQRKVDGLVLATARRRDPLLTQLAGQGMAVVLVNRVVEDRAFSSVSVDDRAGVAMLVEHLAGLGHRHIAHVAGPQSLSTGYQRYRGFVTSMRKRGLKPEKSLVSYASRFSIAEGQRCGTEVLSKPDRPTAIVAGNDMLALGCYSALDHLGLQCPEDVSIVGFNDMPFMERLNPPLTTVRIPHYEIGTRAAELLLDRMADGDGTMETVLLPPELVVRRSTGPARPTGDLGSSGPGTHA